MRGDQERVLDILEAIGKIMSRRGGRFEAFAADETLLVWAVYHFQIIGEAAARVSEKMRQSHPEVPWADMVAMRNVLVHHYFGIDAREVWATIEKDLPALERLLQGLTRGKEAPEEGEER
jgi:uncharacterized protein with HEPN domain